MLPRLALLSLLAAAASGLGLTGQAAGRTGGVTVSRVSRGVKLTLSIPRQSYPHNALVKVKVTLQNVSRRTVMVGGASAPECGERGPGVEVLDGGAVVYPPAVPWIMPSCGAHISLIPLRPGHILHHAVLTILRGTNLRGVGSVGPSYPLHDIATPSLHLTLTDEPPPTLTISTTPSLGLTVTPPRTMPRNTFHFMQGVLCPGNKPDTGYGTQTSRWQGSGVSPGGTFSLSAPCSSPMHWVFAGGWLNHPVVSLDYPLHQSLHGRLRSLWLKSALAVA